MVAAFDKAVDPAAATALVGKSIPYFEPAGPAGDRAASPRPLGSLRIVGARLTDAGRTLTLATDPHPRLARYVLPLPATAAIRRETVRHGRNQLRPFRCRGRLEPGRQPGRSTAVDGLVAASRSRSDAQADPRLETA